MSDDVAFVNVKDIKTEPVELEGIADIKTEPMDTGYEYESNGEFVIKREKLDFDNNPLDSEPESKSESEDESESESSVSVRKGEYDPDITSDDFSTTDDDSINSDDLTGEENLENDEDSDLDTAERFECVDCKRFVINLERHVERVHMNFSKNVNSTICGLCLEQFPRRINLKNHQITAHNGNAFACDICDCMTQTHEAIHRHIIRAHSNERTFLCQHCGVGYKFIWDLQRHERNLHMGARERSAVCHLCDKKFFTAKLLKRHIDAVHLNLRPHHCSFDGCNKTFKQKNYLRTHERQVHTKENVYSCIICEKPFSFKHNLTTHMKNIHKT